MNPYRRLVARFYDHHMQRLDQLCLAQWRRQLLDPLFGRVVEIGAGTGGNLEYYSAQVAELILAEPDEAMRGQLEKRLRRQPRSGVRVAGWKAEAIPLASGSVDFVVSTLVFCSLDDPRRAAAEIRRILKPGGRLVVMEHVAAVDRPGLRFWQRFWQPLWRRIACNCHPARETAEYLCQSGLIPDFRCEAMLGVPAIFSPMIVGAAVKPVDEDC